jgi:subtilisin family serine protease
LLVFAIALSAANLHAAEARFTNVRAIGKHPAQEQPLAVQSARPLDAKMDAGLRSLVDRVRTTRGLSATQAAERFASFMDPVSPFHLLPVNATGEHEAFVYLRLDSSPVPAQLSRLEAQGAEIVLEEGALVLARMPVSRIEDVAALPEVRSMALSQRWSSTLDSSRRRTGVTTVHSGGGGLPQAYLGDDVVVGVLDSGIDYTHGVFRTAPGTGAGTSRLIGLFDYSQGPNGTPCTTTQLDAQTCPEIDGTGGHGHGTHVTGIAAGNNRVNGQYVGMAPNADIVFVKGIRDAQSNGGFSDADVINGVAFMMNQALSAGKPISVNLSLGSQLGAHDGTSLQEQFMDNFAGPGRIITAAAGNSGGDSIHVSYAASGTNYSTGHESWLFMTGAQAAIDLWAPASSNVQVGLAIWDPATLGSGPVFVTNAVSPGQLAQGGITIQGVGTIANVAIDARTAADQNNGDRNCLIQMQLANGVDPQDYIFSVYTCGTGTFDMWAVVGGVFPSVPGAPSSFRFGDDAKTIGIPACARRILCVGSHVSKTSWVDVDGVGRVIPTATFDDISDFSSRGPSRDGRILPNFTAPGEAIISALSKDYFPQRALIAQGGNFQVQQGTSQASPHVTGIVALMLQRDPALTPENVRQILQSTALAAGGAVPNNTFGMGKVRAVQAILATPDPLQCMVVLPNGTLVACGEVADQPLSLMAYPNPSPGALNLSFLAPTSMHANLALYDLMGRRVRTLIDGDVAPGTRSEHWAGDDDAGRPLPSGLYFARLITPSGARTVRFMLTR